MRIAILPDAAGEPTPDERAAIAAALAQLFLPNGEASSARAEVPRWRQAGRAFEDDDYAVMREIRAPRHCAP